MSISSSLHKFKSYPRSTYLVAIVSAYREKLEEMRKAGRSGDVARELRDIMRNDDCVNIPGVTEFIAELSREISRC